MDSKTPETDERAALAGMVIGPDRRRKLIERYADGLVLKYGMTLAAASRYATAVYEVADPLMLLSVGQVWARRGCGPMPGDTIADLHGRERDEAVTVTGFAGDMVEVGKGRMINYCAFAGMWLVSWPQDYQLDDDRPAPPAEPIAGRSPESAGGEDGGGKPEFDPRTAWFLVHRTDDRGISTGEGIPLLGQHYRARNWKKPEYEPCYGNALDIVDYLAEHLADYRAGWSDFTATRDVRGEWFGYFNEFDDGCECGIELAAYLGHWLWRRVAADVVREYGGKADDYEVMTMWSPGKADIILAAAPYADPEWRIPPGHRLAQCDGQESLLDLLDGAV